jgi:predicted O-methyltransferase YrrM
MAKKMKKFEIEKYLDSESWFNYKTFYDFISSKNYSVLVEVGVWKGHSISYLAKQNPSSKIYAVDLFDETYRYKKKNLKMQVPYLYEIYNINLERFNVRDKITDIKGFSWECASKFKDNSVDFVYIDADHRYESVKKDLNAWFSKVTPGGIFAGHDYEPYEGQNHPGIKQAVDEFAFQNNLKIKTFEGCVWYIEI